MASNGEDENTVTSLPPTEAAPPADTAHDASSSGGSVLAARYRLRSLLGEGGMGRVYEADDLELGERVALKLLRRDLAFDRSLLERFRQEVRLARKVTHPNVARVYDIGDDRGHRFLTMELVLGESLGSLLQRTGRLPPSQVVMLMRAACEGLAASHAAGVLHGDLKPHNMMLTPEGRLVLMDFGVARALSAVRGGTTDLAGTAAYMAPEQVTSEPLDERADVYALGVVMFKLLTGAIPFRGPTPLATATARLLADPPDPRSLCDDVPEDLAPIVRRAMARRPDDRFRDARELARELEGLAAASAGGPSAVAVSPTRSAPVTRIAIAVRSSSGEEHAYLDRALADDLDAALKRAPGVEIVPAGLARAAFSDPTEAPHVLYRLSATAVLEARVRHEGSRVKVEANLLGVEDGVLLWSSHFEGAGGDVPGIAVAMARQVATALGSELPTTGGLDTTDPRTVDLYLRGRYAHTTSYFGSDATELLRRAHELAPHVDAIAAHYALALVREGARDLRVERISQARNLAEAVAQRDPTVSHAHLVLCICHLADGEVRSAGLCLRRAIDAAPDDPDALDWHGRMLLEVGRVAEGIEVLRRAIDIEPSLVLAEGSVARGYALLGDFDACFAILDGPPRTPREHEVHFASGARLALWAGDRERIERRARVLDSVPMSEEFGQRVRFLLATYLTGEAEPTELESLLTAARAVGSLRRTGFLSQIAIELLCYVGRAPECASLLEHLDDHGLLDISWLDACPLLAPLRGTEAFDRLRTRTERRAARLVEALSG